MKMDMGDLAQDMVVPATKGPPNGAPMMDGMQAAAEEMMAAMEAKDSAAMASAMRTAMKLCMAEEAGEKE